MNSVAAAFQRFPRRWVLMWVAVAGWVTAAAAPNLPAPVGRVNDFAHVLPTAAAAELDAAMMAFEKTVPIRLVVVTVDSLEGRSVEAYAADLGKVWRVGDPGRDNGIVFLVAVHDRRFRIQTARGARALISDAAADRVRDTVILPYFRRGDLAGGIVAATRALMRAAVPAPAVVESPEAIAARRHRLEARLEAERQRTAALVAAAARRDEAIRTTLWVLGGMVVTGVLLLAGDWVFLRPIRNRQRVLAGKDAFAAKLREVEALVKHPDVKPEVPPRLANLRREAGFLADLRPNITADWNRTRKRFDNMQRALTALESAARMQIDFAAEARRRGPKLLRDLPGVIATTEEQLKKADASPEAKQRLEAAKRSLQQAQTMQSGPSGLDWLVLYALLNDSNTGCTQALEVQHRHETAMMTPPPAPSTSVDFGGGGFDSSGGGGGSSGSW